MFTSVYIDGFNLYYLAVKDTPYKWLDLSKVCQKLVPSHQINRIRYFTALVQPRPGNKQAPRKQLTYLRALETIPNLSTHLGQFRTRKKKGLLLGQRSGHKRIVEILTAEEKGSDVNLVTFLLLDAFNNEYEQALVISNDSDLALPITKLREELTLPVGVVNPSPDPNIYTTVELRDAATFVRRLRETTLMNSQFPDSLTNHRGTIRKPSDW